MFRSIYKKFIPVFVLMIFGFQIVFSSPDSYAQGLIKVADVPGGGSGSTSQSQDSGNSTTTLLIVGGVIIAGIILYQLVIKKDESEEGNKQDTTSSQSPLQLKNTGFETNALSESLRKMQEIPINLYIGFQKVDPLLPERKFVMGVSCNF